MEVCVLSICIRTIGENYLSTPMNTTSDQDVGGGPLAITLNSDRKPIGGVTVERPMNSSIAEGGMTSLPDQGTPSFGNFTNEEHTSKGTTICMLLSMHKNHRRKNPTNPSAFLRLPPGASQYWQRFAAKQRRQHERRAIHHQEWDDLPSRYRQDILWHYY